MTRDDQIDTRCALAALGDDASVAWFLDELEPTDAFIGMPIFRYDDYARVQVDESSRALMRSYGFWEETGEEIGLKRLEARPVATLCLEAQERRELAERQFRDRDDRYR